MKVTVDLPDLQKVVAEAVENALADQQTKLLNWKYFTLKEASELLQIKPATLLDRRSGYLNEIEFSQSGKTFWFLKESVEKFIADRKINRYRR